MRALGKLQFHRHAPSSLRVRASEDHAEGALAQFVFKFKAPLCHADGSAQALHGHW
eukprot:CAMPEP_0115269102 /NCGR_PEP_ID=MMETSP0270-20121206/52865_1 /TAXON_ID=71861 /ORGANISM="Scrippsiella trochoidea, Strain CCMP3099" /LENGTH=55 /DNA_ID=CAMNT_0002685329 /DNA_START=726 /DNA_END=890 /DNA_ORIENTATION=+